MRRGSGAAMDRCCFWMPSSYVIWGPSRSHGEARLLGVEEQLMQAFVLCHLPCYSTSQTAEQRNDFVGSAWLLSSCITAAPLSILKICDSRKALDFAPAIPLS